MFYQIVQHLSPGGIETMAIDLYSHHDGNPSHIISLEGNKDAATSKWKILDKIKDNCVFLNKKQGIDIGIIIQLAKMFKHDKPETVHTHHIGPLLYAGIAARLASVPNIIHTEHDAWHLMSLKARILQKILLWIVQPKIVADSNEVAVNLKDFFPQHHINIINNGIDTDRFVPDDKVKARIELGLPQDKVILGCAARLETVKNHSLLLESFSKLESSIVLVLAGDGSLKKNLQNLAEKLGISDRVYFLGNIDNMPLFYQSIDVFCLTSTHEGLPLSILEAQSCNVPVVSSDAGAIKNAVCPQSGMVFASNNIRELSTCLDIILGKYKTLKPREYIIQHYSLNRTIREYRELCDVSFNNGNNLN